MARRLHIYAADGTLAGLGLWTIIASVLLALSLGSAEQLHSTTDLAQRLHSLLAGIRVWS